MEIVPAADNATHTDGTLQGPSLCLELLAKMPDPAIWVDPDGLVAFANGPATELLGTEGMDTPLAEVAPYEKLTAGVASARDSGELAGPDGRAVRVKPCSSPRGPRTYHSRSPPRA